MPQTAHVEKHFTSSEMIRDIVIGMSDGLTVPFALAAGLSGAVDAVKIVLTAGFAEIAAGAIAMGLGGYLAAKTDLEHYESERAREVRETQEIPEEEAAEIAAIFLEYGVKEDDVAKIVEALRADEDKWVEFMMRYELGLEKPDPRRARRSALTIGISYIVGGMIPLSPYLVLGTVRAGLIGSVIVTLSALLVFGFVKGKFTTPQPWRSALQTALVGGLAAAAAFLIASIVS